MSHVEKLVEIVDVWRMEFAQSSMLNHSVNKLHTISMDFHVTGGGIRVKKYVIIKRSNGREFTIDDRNIFPYNKYFVFDF